MSDIANTNANPLDTPLKRCSKCGEWKPLSGYSEDKKGGGGLRASCKACISIYMKSKGMKNAHVVHTYDPSYTKRCPRCRELKHYSEYGKQMSSIDGLRLYCKPCNSAKSAEWAKRNPEKVKEASSLYYLANKKAIREYQLRWSHANPDKSRASEVRRKLRHPEYSRKNSAKWRRNHPDKKHLEGIKYRAEHPNTGIICSHRRRARKLNLPNAFTEANWIDALAYWKNCCAVCGQKVMPNNAFYVLAQDHWIAIADPRPDNPGNTAANIVPLCHSRIGNADGCNCSKSAKDSIEWLNDRYPPKQVKVILARIAAYFEWVAIRDAV